MVTDDLPNGVPSIVLSEDHIATAIQLVCCGAHDARQDLRPGMKEPEITRFVRKSTRRIKRNRRLTSLQILGEPELDDLATRESRIQGRLDLMIQFSIQFGYEDEYLAVECKRVAAGNSALNWLYVKEGVQRFATGKYSKGQKWAIMLGYVLALPLNDVVKGIDEHLVRNYGSKARLQPAAGVAFALGVFDGNLKQGCKNDMLIKHVFVDMVPAQ